MGTQQLIICVGLVVAGLVALASPAPMHWGWSLVAMGLPVCAVGLADRISEARVRRQPSGRRYTPRPAVW